MEGGKYIRGCVEDQPEHVTILYVLFMVRRFDIVDLNFPASRHDLTEARAAQHGVHYQQRNIHVFWPCFHHTAEALITGPDS